MKKYKLSTRISVYIAVILSLAMSGLTIRSLIVKRNVHSVSELYLYHYWLCQQFH